nr:MAG TPA: hypothetical protein [Caudoviricetes sp.]
MKYSACFFASFFQLRVKSYQLRVEGKICP